MAAGLIVLAVIILQSRGAADELVAPSPRPPCPAISVLAACIVLLALIDGGNGRFLSAATAYSTLQISRPSAW